MMETSKAKSKATSKLKKASATEKVSRTRKVTTVKSVPSEEEIRTKAKEVYHDRIARGEHGTAEGDWLRAEQILGGLAE